MGPFGGSGSLELVGVPYEVSGGPLDRPRPLNQERTDLFEDHGPPGVRWGPGSRAYCHLDQAGALEQAVAPKSLKLACLKTMGPLEQDRAPVEEPMGPTSGALKARVNGTFW